MQDKHDVEADEEFAYRCRGLHAAYLSGRNICLVKGWLESIRRIAQDEARPWEWYDEQKVFGESFDVPPTNLVADINDALLALAEADSVRPSILIEVHRALDHLWADVNQIAELADLNNRVSIREVCEEATRSSAIASGLMDTLILSDRADMNRWRRFGDLIGRSLYFLGLEFDGRDLKESVR